MESLTLSFIKSKDVGIYKEDGSELFDLKNVDGNIHFYDTNPCIYEGIELVRVFNPQRRYLEIEYERIKKLGFKIIMFPAKQEKYGIYPKFQGQKNYLKLHSKGDRYPPNYIISNLKDIDKMRFQFDIQKRKVRMIHPSAWGGRGATKWKRIK